MTITTSPASIGLPPRQVHGLLSGGAGGWFARVFTLPHTLVGIAALGFWLFLIFWFSLAQEYPTKILSAKSYHSRKGGVSYSIQYKFTVDGREHTDRSSVSPSEYDRYKDITEPAAGGIVRYFGIGPLKYASYGGFKPALQLFGFLTLWMLFWNGLMSIFVYQLWIKPIRIRRLYSYGTAMHGTIVSKRVRTGKSTSYYVTYSYSAPGQNQPLQMECEVPSAHVWNALSDGQQVTVFCNPAKPKRSVMLEAQHYRL